jgi:AraC-like DNA-binding protein
MPVIPIHQLQERVDSGLEIEFFGTGSKPKEDEPRGAHRDDHYIFFVLIDGSATLMIDFQVLKFKEGTLYYILPGQVHHRITNEAAGGWFLAVDTGLLTMDQRNVLEKGLNLQQPIQLAGEEIAQYHSLLTLLLQKYEEAKELPFSRPIMYSLLQAFTGMVASSYCQATSTENKPSRKAQLIQEFRKELSSDYKTIKSPAVYAEKLNVSLSYLNESLKKVTGLPVSYWIIHEVMLEAKRLLYYSQLTVKEIAFEIGYEDHAYFSRLFRKTTGVTPLAFRQHYRE